VTLLAAGAAPARPSVRSGGWRWSGFSRPNRWRSASSADRCRRSVDDGVPWKTGRAGCQRQTAEVARQLEGEVGSVTQGTRRSGASFRARGCAADPGERGGPTRMPSGFRQGDAGGG
jgi:hypothetical protein